MSNWPLMQETITPEDRQKMSDFVLTADRLTNGDMVRKFEKEWNEWLGSKYSLYVSSGSTANFLLVAAVKEKYKLQNGDKVLVPACTWVTNVAPVMQLGLEPIFCDINFDNFSFDLESLEYIKSIHPDIKLIFVTHLLGFAAENDKYQELFPDAIIIDDVCESHGVRFNDGSRVGSNSIGATFSFYYGHHMTTIEGGMVSTNDLELYDIMKMKRSHGMARESDYFSEYAKQWPKVQKSFLFMTDGYNFRNHEICAVLGSSQLTRLDSMIEKRRENYELFRKIVDNYKAFFYPIAENPTNSSFCFPLVCRSKEAYIYLQEKLNENNIEWRPVAGGNLLSQPFLQDYVLTDNKDISNVFMLNDRGLYLGNNHFVGEKELELLAKILKEMSNDFYSELH